MDTHARNHGYVIVVPTTGALLDTRSFPVTVAGINRAIAWVARRTEADADTLWVIEGTASYDASPLPASSGNTVRYRLNRGGDRQLNRALNIIAMHRTIHDSETRTYLEKRRA